MTQSPNETLYRAYDADGLLLYVGISNDFGKRKEQHSRWSPWFAVAARWSVEKYATRAEVEAAERVAIEEEDPAYNVSFRRTPMSDEVRERLRAHRQEQSDLAVSMATDKAMQEDRLRPHAEELRWLVTARYVDRTIDDEELRRQTAELAHERGGCDRCEGTQNVVLDHRWLKTLLHL